MSKKMWRSARLVRELVDASQPKKRAVPVPVLTGRVSLYVLGLNSRPAFGVEGYSVKYDVLEAFDVDAIYARFAAHRDAYDVFAFVAHAPLEALRAVLKTGTARMELPDHLAPNWEAVMGSSSRPHFSYFALPRAELWRLEPARTRMVRSKWALLVPELRAMVDERNMVLVDYGPSNCS